MKELQLSKELSKEVDRIMACNDTRQLLGELESHFQLTVDHVVKCAAYIRRLEELGVEVTLDVAVIPYLKRVAYGQLSPLLLVNMQGREKLLNSASTLPLPMQNNVAKNKPMKVMLLNGDHRMVPPLLMTNKEVAQVFCHGKVRSETEQIGFLQERFDAEQAKAQTKTQETPVLVDRKRGGIVCNGHFIPVSELARYLGELSLVKR